jgi:hypothetical protein
LQGAGKVSNFADPGSTAWVTGPASQIELQLEKVVGYAVGGGFRYIEGNMSVTAGSASGELKLLSAIAVRPVILDVLATFQCETGLKMTASFELNPAIKKRIEAGEYNDVVIINREMIDDLIR